VNTTEDTCDYESDGMSCPARAAFAVDDEQSIFNCCRTHLADMIHASRPTLVLRIEEDDE
jgi:hypothetical protein